MLLIKPTPHTPPPKQSYLFYSKKRLHRCQDKNKSDLKLSKEDATGTVQKHLRKLLEIFWNKWKHSKWLK